VTARLRHIVLATDDLAADVTRAREGFGLATGIADAGAMREFDLEHAVLVLGSTYLEILARSGTGSSCPGRNPSGKILKRELRTLEEIRRD
jgi:hypothetical protein